MKYLKGVFDTRRRALCGVLVASCLVLIATHFYAYGQNKSDFPDGFDAVQAAPRSHRVVFENAFVRVLEVSVLPGHLEVIETKFHGLVTRSRLVFTNGSVRRQPVQPESR
jgi:hypothetical protein